MALPVVENEVDELVDGLRRALIAELEARLIARREAYLIKAKEFDEAGRPEHAEHMRHDADHATEFIKVMKGEA